MSTLLSLAESIEQSPVGAAIAESRYAFPVIEGVHLIGLSISVGLIFLDRSAAHGSCCSRTCRCAT